MIYPQQILEYALDTVFPVRCIECGDFGAPNKPRYLCRSCLSLIDVKGGLECIGCRRKSPLGRTCIECRGSNSIDNLFIIADYKNPLLQKLLKTFKYRFVVRVGDSFYPLLRKYFGWLAKEKKFSLVADNPIIIPISLHRRRFNWRGFNQSEVIAKMTADILNLELRTDVLSRTGYSKPQAEIEDKKERLTNLRNKFSITPNPNLKNRTIILIDDICTSGTTLNEAASVLKNNGAEKVIGLVIARG